MIPISQIIDYLEIAPLFINYTLTNIFGDTYQVSELLEEINLNQRITDIQTDSMTRQLILNSIFVVKKNDVKFYRKFTGQVKVNSPKIERF